MGQCASNNCENAKGRQGASGSVGRPRGAVEREGLALARLAAVLAGLSLFTPSHSGTTSLSAVTCSGLDSIRILYVLLRPHVVLVHISTYTRDVVLHAYALLVAAINRYTRGTCGAFYTYPVEHSTLIPRAPYHCERSQTMLVVSKSIARCAG